MRARRLAFLAAVALGIVGSVLPAAAAPTFQVTASGQSAYRIDGVNNPTLTLTRGQTYTFTLDIFTSGHPFWITTARGAEDAETNQWSLGVTGNGSAPGTITFVVPSSAPSTLFYQCKFHDPMGGTLNIVSAPAVPSIGPAMAAALAGLLFLIAVVLLRARSRSSGNAIGRPRRRTIND